MQRKKGGKVREGRKVTGTSVQEVRSLKERREVERGGGGKKGQQTLNSSGCPVSLIDLLLHFLSRRTVCCPALPRFIPPSGTRHMFASLMLKVTRVVPRLQQTLRAATRSKNHHHYSTTTALPPPALCQRSASSASTGGTRVGTTGGNINGVVKHSFDATKKMKAEIARQRVEEQEGERAASRAQGREAVLKPTMDLSSLRVACSATN